MAETLTLRTAMRVLQQNALGGKKVPHGVSNPVLRKMPDGNYVIAAFIYLYKAEELKAKNIPRPSRWLTMDPVSGRFLQEYACTEQDFSDIPLTEFCNLRAADDTVYSREYTETLISAFDTVLRKYRETGRIDLQLYDVYLQMMLKTVSVGFKPLYQQLSNIT